MNETSNTAGIPCPEVETMGVAEFLRLISLPGEHREIRVLHGETTLTKAPHTFSGVFSLASIDTMATTLTRQPWRRYGGIYVTMNPLAPTYQNLQEAPSGALATGGTCAKDKDMLCRRWLLVDLDAKRVRAHDPASLEEHAATVERARTIWTTLTAEGWGKPLVIDSGNGVQMFWRIDLPTQDGGLVKRVLQGFDRRFSDAQVAVDLSVHNAARLCRVAGTWNIKGVEVPEQARHYRLARILATPQALVSVTQAQLEAMAKQASPQGITLTPELQDALPTLQSTLSVRPKTSSPSATGPFFTPRRFDIDTFMSTHFPEAQAVPYEGGRKWVLKVCPFNPEHNRGEAVVIERADGTLGYVCHHNSCQGYDWHALRARMEGERAPTSTAAWEPETEVLPPAEDIAPEVSATASTEPRRGFSPSEGRVLFSKERPPLIEGVLREGETMNIIAAPKVGKSWLVLQLAHCVATGSPWLGHACARKKVLYVDNELHHETFFWRLTEVENAMKIDPNELAEWLVIDLLRGKLEGIERTLAAWEARIREEHIGLLIIDAFYRALPEGCEENSNSDMRKVYNLLDHFAQSTGAAIVLVHHTSKGDQSEKQVTDVGAGAGTVSRAADTHLVILPHPKMKGYAQLQATTRSFPALDAWCLRRTKNIWKLVPLKEQTPPENPVLIPTIMTLTNALHDLDGCSDKSHLLELVRKRCRCSRQAAQKAFEQAIAEGALRTHEIRGKNNSKAIRCTLPEAPLQEDLPEHPATTVA